MQVPGRAAAGRHGPPQDPRRALDRPAAAARAPDPQQRELHPPSTAATLNLAATAAQAARLYRALRRRPSPRGPWPRRARHGRRPWPTRPIYARPNDGTGGGAYDDTDVTDEFYWAAAELYLTTGEKPYARRILRLAAAHGRRLPPGGFDWGQHRRARPARPGDRPQQPARPGPQVRALRRRRAPTSYLATLGGAARTACRTPREQRLRLGLQQRWSSTTLVVIATAYDITGDPKYRDGVLQGMDYILGRNALNQSYVTGYGEVNSHNQHSRWYAHQLDPNLPQPAARIARRRTQLRPSRTPAHRRRLQGCASRSSATSTTSSPGRRTRYAINWNAALSWVASFVADQGTRPITDEHSKDHACSPRRWSSPWAKTTR